MARKEKLRKLASKGEQGTEDYSAKADYINKGGMMGKNEFFSHEEVYEDKVDRKSGKITKVSHKTKDRIPGKGKGEFVDKYKSPKIWFNFLNGPIKLSPNLKPEHKGFAFKGQIYGITPTGKGGTNESSPDSTRV